MTTEAMAFARYGYRVAVAAVGALCARPVARCEASASSGETQEELLSRVVDDASRGLVDRVLIGAERLEVRLKDATAYEAALVPWLDVSWLAEKLRGSGVAFGAAARPAATGPGPAERRAAALKAAVAVIAPCAYLWFAYKILMRASKGPIDESVAKRHRKHRNPGRPEGFRVVAGVDEAKRELEEIVAVLRDPTAFKAMGAKCPRGVLLTGPSGTGKTLLAKAVADEAECAFLFCSASAFVELLVGRGAARVRDLFKRARALAPCVVFIDEIDAIAKARGLLGQSDEREQTLNQILCELDGFDAKADEAADRNLVILLAATNRPEILDAALVRPGRLDRCVTVPLPDQNGREAILAVHANNVRLHPNVDLKAVAKNATGFSGADLANVVNEAALLAVRTAAPSVSTLHLQKAVLKARQGKDALRGNHH